MKRSMFCLLTRCVAILATAVFTGSLIAQDPPASPFDYKVEYAYFPPEYDGSGRLRDVGKVNGELIIVGYHKRVSGQLQNRGFVYFHETNSFVDMHTFLQLAEIVWIESYCTGLNTNGLVVGAVKDVNGKLHGCWFDLLATNPTLKLLEDDFPEIVDGNDTNARAFNSNGEILVDNGWVVNINDGTSQQLPAEFSVYIDINDLGTVLGRGATASPDTTFTTICLTRLTWDPAMPRTSTIWMNFAVTYRLSSMKFVEGTPTIAARLGSSMLIAGEMDPILTGCLIQR